MRKTAVVIGAGPAGLSAAECLAEAGVKVHVYERTSSPARKFLMAGRGGLNVTHSEDIGKFISRYGEAAERIAPFLREFGPERLRAWCAGLGQETFVGSSGKVFPKSFKSSPLLRAWLRRLAELDVEFHLRHRFERFDGQQACFESPEGFKAASADAFVLALGGASWPRLGADGGWVEPLRAMGLNSTPLRPANSGFVIPWSEQVSGKFAGQPLKNVRLLLGELSVRGECVVTRNGLEGGAVYAVSRQLAGIVEAGQTPDVRLDLKPDVPVEKLAAKLSRPRGKASLSNFLRKAAGLPPAAIALLRETGALPADPHELAQRIKAAPLDVRGVGGLDRAISTAGGVMWEGLDDTLMAKAFPGLFVAGEMLDWDAPTGGYLLTACFATGRAAGLAAAQWLRNSESR